MQDYLEKAKVYWQKTTALASQGYTFVNQRRYQWLTHTLMVFLVTRFIVFMAAYLAEIAIPGVEGDAYYHVNRANIFLDVWARWDSAFYLNIIQFGYWFQPGYQSSVAFFPLYPLMMGIIEPIVGSYLAAGVWVSNLCLLGALFFLYRLTELEFGDVGAATRAIFYIAAFPTSFFFTAVYTESTFLLFAVGSMYFARKQLWGWAALMGMLCSASRIVGVIMWGVVGLEWLRAHGWTLTTIHRKESWQNLVKALRTDYISLAIICMIPLGLFSYMYFLKHVFDDPVAFSTTQSAWGRQTVGPFVIIRRDTSALFTGNIWSGQIWYHIALDLAAFFAVVLAAIPIWRRLGASYALYSLLCVLIPVSSGTQSISRYMLVIFPFFMMLGWWGRYQAIDRTVTIGFSVFLGIMTAVFVNWIFIA